MNKFLMSCVAVVVVMLLAFAIPVPLAANGGSNGDCYPGTASAFASGATWASGEAKGNFEEVEVDRHGFTTEIFKATGADIVKIDLEFNAKLTGNTTSANGISTGTAEVTFNWLSPTNALLTGITKTVFESGCVFEIETDHQNGGIKVGEFEGEWEGYVKDFPGYPNTTKAAVLSIVAHEDPDNAGSVAVEFNIELGYDCLENVYTVSNNGPSDANDIEFDKITIKKLDAGEFKINNLGHHQRITRPDALQNNTCAAN